MREIRKYNSKTREVEKHYVPKEWRLALWNTRMDEVVNCAGCGKEILFGECYTSRYLFNGAGLGYGMCLLCYAKEDSRRWSV